MTPAARCPVGGSGVGGIGMRRTAALLVSCSLALVVAAPVAGHEVSMSRGTYLVAEAAWGTLDAETMTGDQSVVAVEQLAPGEWYLVYQRLTLHEVTCDMGTKSTADDESGLAGTMAVGEGEPDTMRVDARRLRWAEAAGMVEVIVFEVDTCEDVFEPVADELVDVSLDLEAAGRLRRTHDRMRWVEPGVFKDQTMLHITERSASGTATVDGRGARRVLGHGHSSDASGRSTTTSRTDPSASQPPPAGRLTLSGSRATLALPSHMHASPESPPWHARPPSPSPVPPPSASSATPAGGRARSRRRCAPTSWHGSPRAGRCSRGSSATTTA